MSGDKDCAVCFGTGRAPFSDDKTCPKCRPLLRSSPEPPSVVPPEASVDAIVDPLVAERRAGCCADRRKPAGLGRYDRQGSAGGKLSADGVVVPPDRWDTLTAAVEDPRAGGTPDERREYVENVAAVAIHLVGLVAAVGVPHQSTEPTPPTPRCAVCPAWDGGNECGGCYLDGPESTEPEPGDAPLWDAVFGGAPESTEAPSEGRCPHCSTCNPQVAGLRMILCEICGNKRCPHATDHRLACTRSNEPNQPGSAYQYPPAPPVPDVPREEEQA